jgi:DNA-binding SARP family transcriptional activator/tetratricopeptide (TPR) repeat protein/DNA-binding XRE family transcriptional regulator
VRVRTLGELVRHHRRRGGLTQQELAGRAGLSVRTLRNIEQDRIARPRADSVRDLAAALGLAEADREELLARLPVGGSGAGVGRLRIGVLGSLSVRRGDVPVGVGSALQRDLLGLLALQPGRTVTCAEIVDVLWGEHPPRTCLGLVHTYVGRLRDLLEPRRQRWAPGRVIGQTASGYVFRLDVDQLDVALFDQLVEAARSADAAGDTVGACERYLEAVRCWRGPAVVDAGARLRAHPVVVAVGQRRLAAVLAFADVAAQLGRHQQVVIYLREVAADAALHEGVHARLMTALAGSGEQAAALAVFADIRARLVDELGVEPGAELRAAHLRVLRGQAPPAAEEPEGAQRVCPAQLPADVAAFTGRKAHLDALDALLPDGDTTAAGGRRPTAVVITAIDGTAGVGKTALAVHWAHRVAGRFGDGQLYVNLRGFAPAGTPTTPAEAVRGFLDALDVPPQRIPASLDAQAALYRSLVSGKRMLVVLDNARDVEQVRPLLPGASGCLVVVTSRNRLTGLVAADGARPLTLDVLTVGEAHDLFTDRLGPDRVAAEPEAAEAVITACGRLPLALAIVAARAATHPHLPLHTLAGELRGTATGLDALSAGEPATDIRAVFSWSYQALSDDAARLFRLLGLHPGPDTTAPAAASLAALPTARVRPLLAELERANLILEHTPGRYTLHDLLRAYATDLAHTTDPDRERRAATGRLLDHYLHTAHAADRLLNTSRDSITLTPPRPGVTPEDLADLPQALAWFTTERAVLLAAVDHAAATGFDTHTCHLAWTLRTFANRRGHWHDWAAAGHTALTAAGRLADPTAQARAHRHLASAYTRLGRFDDGHTHLSHALDLATQAGDQAGQARTHHTLGYLRERQGRYAEALDHARQALDLHRAAGHRGGEADALNNVGWYHALLGDHQQALTHCQQAITLHQEHGDRDGQAATWDSLGYAHHHLGHHTQAITCYQHALDLYRDVGDRYYEAGTLTHLGDTHHAAGNPTAARAAWQQALTILTDLDHPDADTVHAKLAAHHDLSA